MEKLLKSPHSTHMVYAHLNVVLLVAKVDIEML